MSSSNQSIAPAPSAPESNALLRRTFRFGIGLKGLHALLESALGITLFVIPPGAINTAVWRIGRLDLSRNPHDVIGAHLRHFGEGFTGSGRHFAAVYLLSHGLLKLIVVIELLKNRLWAYPLMMVMLAVFIGYQSYRYSLTHSTVMMLLTIFDLAVGVLTWMEYREQLHLRAAAQATPAGSSI